MTDATENQQVPEGALARAQIDVTLGNGEGIVAGDQGLWATIRNGLSTSVAGLLWSLQLIVIGLFLVGPWDRAAVARLEVRPSFSPQAGRGVR